MSRLDAVAIVAAVWVVGLLTCGAIIFAALGIGGPTS
jgi:hypothetical protein